MRWHRVGLVVGTLGCGIAEEPQQQPMSTEPSRDLPSSSSSDAKFVSSARIRIDGVLDTNGASPSRGLTIGVVDAQGERFATTSDEHGGFVVEGVVAPYDLMVDGVVAWLDLTSSDPHVAIDEGPPPPVTWVQSVRLHLPHSACPIPGGTIHAMTRSTTGAGARSLSCERAHATANDEMLMEVTHVFRTPPIDGDTIALDIVVANSPGNDKTDFAHGRIGSIAVEAGSVVDLGDVTLEAVSDSILVSMGTEAGTLLGWAWRNEVSVGFGGDGRVLFAAAESPRQELRLPVLDDLWVYPILTAWDRRFDGRLGISQFVQAWGEPHRAKGESVTLSMPEPPAVARPQPNGSFSRGEWGFMWSAAVPSLSMVVVDDEQHRLRLRVFTNDSQVSLDRLRSLGARELDSGRHSFELTTSPRVTSDELVVGGHWESHLAPGRAERAGQRTWLQMPFFVEP